MAGDWTAIEHTTPRKPEIAQIAISTGRSRHEVLGLMVEFWGWVETQTTNGTVDMPVTALETFVGADSQFWRAVVRAGWIILPEGEASTSFKIPRAHHWLSKGAKARLAKNRRQVRWRQKRRLDVDARPSTKPSTTEQKRREENKEPSYDGSSGEAAIQEAAVLVFPCSGDGAKTWPITESKLAEWRGSYPGIDVLSECRKALQWCRDNPTRIKTARGTPAFISRWLSKAQDQSKGLFNGGTGTQGNFGGNDATRVKGARTTADFENIPVRHLPNGSAASAE